MATNLLTKVAQKRLVTFGLIWKTVSGYYFGNFWKQLGNFLTSKSVDHPSIGCTTSARVSLLARARDSLAPWRFFRKFRRCSKRQTTRSVAVQRSRQHWEVLPSGRMNSNCRQCRETDERDREESNRCAPTTTTTTTSRRRKCLFAGVVVVVAAADATAAAAFEDVTAARPGPAVDDDTELLF